ncbi:MAG: aspartate/glutamate racemase family protein [Coxiellaceae bacterium]|nr:aspartate/glutamate racemase family protein [Coxiellaceae bacterium]
MSKPLIGALVGMGPKSTAPFYQSVIDEASKQYDAKNDIDFPDLLMYSLPTPFVVGKSIDDNLMKQQLTKGIGVLVEAGVQLIAVPCNLVHLYHNHMQQAAGQVPVLNMVELAVNALSPHQANRIAILATAPTIESELYQQALLAKGIEPFVSAPLQSLVDQLIMLTKLNSVEPDEIAQQWKKLLTYLSDHRCTAALIGCTDLSLCEQYHSDNGIVFFDAMRALTSQFIRHYRQWVQ